MTLLITLTAAVISTIVWYCLSSNEMNVGTLSLMYWGASLMWFVDAVVEYLEIGVQYFTPDMKDMINDSYLGISAVVFGLIIWLFVVLIKDPKNKIKKVLLAK